MQKLLKFKSQPKLKQYLDNGLQTNYFSSFLCYSSKPMLKIAFLLLH